MINVIDAIIILFLLAGCIIGLKKGAIQMLAYFIGTFLVVFIAYYLKHPLAKLMYMHLPFFKLNGVFKGISSYNILIYEGIAFLLILSVLIIVLKLLLKVTGILSKIVDNSIILTLPSKLIGILLGFFESYIIIFTLLYIFASFGFSNVVLSTSKLTPTILHKTPLSSEVKNNYKATKEIIKIAKEKISEEDKNTKSLDTLLKYGIIDEESAKILIKNNKIDAKE